MQNNKKAENFYEIQDAVAFNIPVSSNSPFYTDLTPYRKDFTERELFLQLNIEPNTKDCNQINRSSKIFLSGYRGTGKTSELLKLAQKIDETNCYFTVFIDISEEEMDTSNIDTVDILMLMLKKLLKKLESKGANVSNVRIEEFYEWYTSTIIKESNVKLDTSAKIEVGANAQDSILGKLIGVVANTTMRLQGSSESKETIRRVIKNNYKMFSDRFNELVNSIVTKLQEHSSYKDILFIVDGFEKIGSLEDRKKILVDDSNKLTMLNTHMIVTLPIELFTYKNQLVHNAVTMSFPLIDLETQGAKECFREFILKRVSKELFKDDSVIDLIIEFGAGHPRQTLQIISRAFLKSTKETIDKESVLKSIEMIGSEIAVIKSKDEFKIIQEVLDNEVMFDSDIFLDMKSRNIIFEYGEFGKSNKINPIVLENSRLKELLEKFREK